MSNRWAGVRGWAGVGACSAEGVCGGRNLAKIRFRHRLRPKDSSEGGGEQGSEGGRWRFCWDFIYTKIHRLRLKDCSGGGLEDRGGRG